MVNMTPSCVRMCTTPHWGRGRCGPKNCCSGCTLVVVSDDAPGVPGGMRAQCAECEGCLQLAWVSCSAARDAPFLHVWHNVLCIHQLWGTVGPPPPQVYEQLCVVVVVVVGEGRGKRGQLPVVEVSLPWPRCVSVCFVCLSHDSSWTAVPGSDSRWVSDDHHRLTLGFTRCQVLNPANPGPQGDGPAYLCFLSSRSRSS